MSLTDEKRGDQVIKSICYRLTGCDWWQAKPRKEFDVSFGSQNRGADQTADLISKLRSKFQHFGKHPAMDFGIADNALAVRRLAAPGFELRLDQGY